MALLEGTLDRRTGIFVVVLTVVTAIAADQFWPGWGHSVGTTVCVFSGASLIWPQFRRRYWYWLTWSLLLTAQVVLLLRLDALRAFVENLHPLLWFALSILDFFVVALAIILVASACTKREVVRQRNKQ